MLIRHSSVARLTLVAALLAVIGAIAGVVYAAQSQQAEVRIAALRHESGRVEVALQQLGPDGAWSDRVLPDSRFLQSDVVGHWRYSSPLPVQVAAADGVPSGDELYCIVHHGAADDRFWIQFNLFARTNAAELGLRNLEIHGEPEIGNHAAAISDCVARGALAIATSLPALDGLREALSEVRDRATFLITFNSGAKVAGEVGSMAHVGLDDALAGELAGREFNAAGASGTLLCVIHEAGNVGLADRCDGLARAYAGSVERIQAPAGSLSDPELAGRAIGEAIVAHEAVAVLVLNEALARPVIAAVDTLGADVLVGAFGMPEGALGLLPAGKLLFGIPDTALQQAGQVVMMLQNIDASQSERARLAITAAATPFTPLMLIRPDVFNLAAMNSLPADWRARTCALGERIGASPEWLARICPDG